MDGGGIEQATWYLLFITDLLGLAQALLRHCGEAPEPAIDAALKFLANHGVTATRRAQPLREDFTIASQEMALSRYEEGRPDAGEACRHGDQRVIAGQGWQGPRDFEAEITEILGKPKAEA